MFIIVALLMWCLLGKGDHSAASAAYDSLVNQLLTLMDGLRYSRIIVGLLYVQ